MGTQPITIGQPSNGAGSGSNAFTAEPSSFASHSSGGHRQRQVSVSVSPSGAQSLFQFGTSPTSHPYPQHRPSTSPSNTALPKALTPFVPSSKANGAAPITKILLLENVNQSAIEMFRQNDFVVETENKSLGEAELIARVKEGGFSVLGIRSKTQVTERVIKETGGQLLAIGCFCIGTNQVDLLAAARAGVAVFNSPFANSRSVAELVIAEIIALSRQLIDRGHELRNGVWNKVSKGCWEVRGKTLGIVGYGHIGSQLSVLAEAMGIQVIYYDVLPIMPLGSARQVDSLDDLLDRADFVTLHVPELPETVNMIGAEQISKMRQGAYLINNARGRVVDLPALAAALKDGYLAGAAIDVFPAEPKGNGPHFNAELGPFIEDLRTLPNVILTPHIGGSTEEAQRMIGAEVGSAVTRYINLGSTVGAVNFPEVSLRPILEEGTARVCHVHLNQPGVLKQINAILGDYNVEKQFSDSKGDIAYLLADIGVGVTPAVVKDIYEKIVRTESNVLSRILC